MEPIAHRSTSFSEAERWDIQQQVNMTPDERQHAAKQLRERFYGKDVPDVRDVHAIPSHKK